MNQDLDEAAVEREIFLQEQVQKVLDMQHGMAQEGLAGLADFEGMMDRQAAQRELEDRFVVTGEGETAPAEHAPNVVSSEEYQQIARTYSDIRLGRADLMVDASAAPADEQEGYEESVMADIADILQTESGRSLIDSLAYNPLEDHYTLIAASLDNTTAQGGAYSPNGPDPAAQQPSVGAKRTFAQYSPGMFGGIVDPGAGPDGEDVAIGRSDQVLFHELVHAHHAAYGTEDGGLVDPFEAETADDMWIEEREYQAVGLGDYAGDKLTENTYLEERERIGATDIGEREDAEGVKYLDDDNMPRRASYAN